MEGESGERVGGEFEYTTTTFGFCLTVLGQLFLRLLKVRQGSHRFLQNFLLHLWLPNLRRSTRCCISILAAILLKLCARYFADQMPLSPTSSVKALTECAWCNCQDPKIYVQTILYTHKKYNMLVMTAFSNDSGFVESLDKVRCSVVYFTDNAVYDKCNDLLFCLCVFRLLVMYWAV